jgi:peptide subunit release factor RF-3
MLGCQQVLGEDLDNAEVLAGRVTPMYFGSAFSNFGVEPFLEVSTSVHQASLLRTVPLLVQT